MTSCQTFLIRLSVYTQQNTCRKVLFICHDDTNSKLNENTEFARGFTKIS